MSFEHSNEPASQESDKKEDDRWLTFRIRAVILASLFALMMVIVKPDIELIRLLFIFVYVLFPFVLYILLIIRAKLYSALSRKILHILFWVLTVISLAIYCKEIFYPTNSKPNVLLFYLVPSVSSYVLLIVDQYTLRMQSRRDGSV